MKKKSDRNEHEELIKTELKAHLNETHELFENLTMHYEEVIRVLIKIVEEKDRYTRGHSESVTRLVVKLARKLGLSRTEVSEIREASLLHDIGKIAIDRRILNKPGPLTEEECERIKEHPAIGARIVEQSYAFRCLVPGVRHHHERYEGGGYPNPKLKKGHIPLYARIICIADAWDAMRSNRSYRRALSREEAMSEIRRCIGTQFDPKIARVFLAII